MVIKTGYCSKCRKNVQMERCEVCKGTGGGRYSQCIKGCGRKGWLCPTHGKNY